MASLDLVIAGVSRDPGRNLPGFYLDPANCAKSPYVEIVGEVLEIHNAQDQTLPCPQQLEQCEVILVDAEDKHGTPTPGSC